MNIQIIAALLSKLHLLASLLNQWIYAAKVFFSFCWISIKQLADVWMSELQIFKWRVSLISSQVLFEHSASDISVHFSPFDFACANLVLLCLVGLKAFLYQWTNLLIVKNHCHWKLVYLVVRCSQRMFSFVQYIKCLYIVAKPPQWVLAKWCRLSDVASWMVSW